jgi:hypothetical protein
MESIPELVPLLDPIDREIALTDAQPIGSIRRSGRDSHLRNIQKSGEVEEPRRPRIDAIDHRKVRREDWWSF